MVMLLSAEAPSNALSPIDVIKLGRVILVSAGVYLKALAGIEVSKLLTPNVTVSRWIASENALLPIVVTLAGMLMLVSVSALSNAPAAIAVAVSGITAAPEHEIPSETVTDSPTVVSVKVPPPVQLTVGAAVANAGATPMTEIPIKRQEKMQEKISGKRRIENLIR
jgi:hypothetical protein